MEPVGILHSIYTYFRTKLYPSHGEAISACTSINQLCQNEIIKYQNNFQACFGSIVNFYYFPF